MDDKGNLVPLGKARELLDRLVAPKDLTLKVTQTPLNHALYELTTILVGRCPSDAHQGQPDIPPATSDNSSSAFPQNLVQGELVNGSVGRVVNFSAPRDARNHGADIARTQLADGSREKIPEQILEIDHPFPVVEFPGGRRTLCIPATFEVMNGEGRVEAARDQVRL